MSFPVEKLRSWFLAQGRSLPWRENPTPYAVWVSEVMLQQTQVSVVIPYFTRWMERFPTIEALANASQDDVIKLWEGLGYYSRARHLHAGAQMVGKTLPSDPEALAKVKGLGRYTIGAIRSFAFHEKTAAVDGNVMRLLARFFLIEGEIERIAVQNEIWKRAEALLPDARPWEISEALIELGALICQKKARCVECPLKKECLAHRHQRQNELPHRKPRVKTTHLRRSVGVIEADDHLLLARGEKGKVMADLYEFPFEEGKCTPKSLQERLEERFGLELEHAAPLPEQKHTFTRFRVHLFPHHFRAKKRPSHLSWMAKQAINTVPFSSGHRKIYENFTH